MIENALIFDKS